MSRKRNKGLDRRGRLMLLMWMSIWLGGSLWSGLHGGNGLLTAVWHGFLVMAGCMGLLLVGSWLWMLPEEQRRYHERIERERDEKRKLNEEWHRRHPGTYDYTRPSDGDSGCIPFT